MNREAVLLALQFDADKHKIGGQLMSEKLDGQRVIWDGGVSRGCAATSVPYAFNPKPGEIATGLWTRNFKVVHAPDFWIDKWTVPGVCLDGEGYIGVGRFQETESVLRTERINCVDARWESIRYVVFDSPALEDLLMDGTIRIRTEKHELRGCLRWAIERGAQLRAPKSIEAVLQLPELQHLLHQQERLPLQEAAAREVMYSRLDEVSSKGGEGLMIRKINSYWRTKRCDDILKVKKFLEGRAVVRGYTEGKGRLVGMCGALIVETLSDSGLSAGIDFEIAGMTDEERNNARTYFPIGSEIRFKYNDTTDSGKPKHARVWR